MEKTSYSLPGRPHTIQNVYMIIAIEATPAQGQGTGLGVYVRNLLRVMPRLAPAHTFLLLHANRRWQGPDFGPNCRPVSYWCGKQSLAIRFRLNRVLRQTGAELFHVTCTTGAPPTCCVPVITTVHDLYPLIAPEACRPAHRVFFRLLWGWTLRSSQRFIANSEFTATELARLAGLSRDRITAIPLAADSERPPPRQTLCQSRPAGLDDLQEPFMLCLGAVEPRKGQLFLAEAWAATLADTPGRPELVFAGPDRGDGAALAARLREPRFRGRARWLGEVDLATRDWLYAQAGAFVFPSFYEGFGLPVLEAMRRFLPVLCADIPVLREVAGEAALFVAPGDLPAWVAALQRLTGDPELRLRLRDRGVDREAQFTWEQCARNTLEAYGQLLPHRF